MFNNTASQVARDTSVQHFGSTGRNVDIACFIHTLVCHSETVDRQSWNHWELVSYNRMGQAYL